jgi:hypothetical protein
VRRTAQASGGLRGASASIPCARVTFACPLCRGLGHASTLVAKLEPEPPPLLTVIDLQGGCEHAAGFGQLDQLTLEREWRLIEAALDAAIGEGS